MASNVARSGCYLNIFLAFGHGVENSRTLLTCAKQGTKAEYLSFWLDCESKAVAMLVLAQDENVMRERVCKSFRRKLHDKHLNRCYGKDDVFRDHVCEPCLC